MRPDFEGVIVAARGGAEWAFEVLYRDLNPALIRYLASQVPRAAEDLAAETWMGAARSISVFEGGEAAFRAWLFKIAYRRVVQYWRDSGRDGSIAADPYTLQDHVDPMSVEDAVIATDSLSDAARRVTEVLTPDQSSVVLLRIFAGLTVGDVADVLGKRPGTVRVLQHKALKKLAAANFSLEAITTCD